MAILTCKQTCECISLQIFSKYPIQKSRDRTNPPDFPTLKAYPTPSVGGRFGIFSLKWRERMNLKVPGATLPLGCAILSTRARIVRGGWYNPPLGELGLSLVYTCRFFYSPLDVVLYLTLVLLRVCSQTYFLKGGSSGLSILKVI